MNEQTWHKFPLDNGLQLTHIHTTSSVSSPKHLWVLSIPKRTRYGGEEFLSRLETDQKGKINRVETEEEHRRQGHATTLFNAAKEHASKVNAPIPTHSTERTKEGNSWTKSLGEKGAHTTVSSQQFWNGKG